MRFVRPARLGGELSLSATITRESAGPRDPLLIRGEIRDQAGELLTEGDFEYITLPDEPFLKAVGIDRLPESWRRHFSIP